MSHPPLMSTLTDVIFQGEEVETTSPQSESPVLSRSQKVLYCGARINVFFTDNRAVYTEENKPGIK